MPRTTPMTRELLVLLDRQDRVVTAGQLVANGFRRGTAFRRAREGRWQELLPGVFLTLSGQATRRQLLVAAWLWAGTGSAIDGADALRWYGFDVSRPSTAKVHVVVPAESSVRSRDFVVVRRAAAHIDVGGRGLVEYVDRPTAAVVAARNARNTRDAIALLSRLLQQGAVTTSELHEARARIGDKWCRPVDAALLAVGIGVRSPAEDDMRRLVLTSRVLPEPQWNRWLGLPDGGQPVCVDGLLEDAGLVYEVIGKRYHAWGEQYDDTNARKERLQAAGLVVCEATPIRIRRQATTVLANLEQTYALHRGRGMPPGVVLLDPPANRAQDAL